MGAVLDSLSSAEDRLWPRGEWPSMRLDRPLGVGAAGGHGPVRYTVSAYEPARRVLFTFTGPRGFNGTHCFEITEAPGGGTLLRHELLMRPTGAARLSWPLFFRPLHDAVIEESFDRAERAVGIQPVGHRRSLWVRALRQTFAARSRRPRSAQ